MISFVESTDLLSFNVENVISRIKLQPSIVSLFSAGWEDGD